MRCSWFRRHRQFAYIAMAVPALLLASACSSTPELISGQQAGAEYQALAEELSSTLSKQYHTAPWQPVNDEQTSISTDQDGRCRLTIGTLRSQDSLPSLAGGWAPVMQTINPVLKKHGFAEVSDEDTIKGGWTGISSTDQHGGKLRIFAKDSTDLSLGGPVSDQDC